MHESVTPRKSTRIENRSVKILLSEKPRKKRSSVIWITEGVSVGSLLCIAGSTVQALSVTPTAYHGLLFHHHDIQGTGQTSHCVVCLCGAWWRGAWVCEYVEHEREGGEGKKTFFSRRNQDLENGFLNETRDPVNREFGRKMLKTQEIRQFENFLNRKT